jgi:hypothetical protein
MSENKSTTWKLDLDLVEFTEKALHAKGTIAEIGESKNLLGLIEGLKESAALIGVMGAAFLAAKTSLELTLEAEQIATINKQFELLSKNAGIAGQELEEGLKKASRGLISEAELTQAANKGIVELGANAARLPEILTLAHKVVQTFGGTAVERFEQLNQAISTGNTRILRQIGLQVDANKVVEEFAKRHNIAASAISEAGRQQAIMEAVLKKGNDRFKETDESVRKATISWQQLKTSIKEMGESITVVFARVVGPTVSSAIASLTDFATRSKQIFMSTFGNAKEQSVANVELIENRLTGMKAKLKSLEEQKLKLGFDPVIGETNSLRLAIERLEKQHHELIASGAAAGGHEKKEPGEEGGAVTGPKLTDDRANEKQKVKFEQDLASLKLQAVNAKMDTVDSVEAIEALHQEKMQLLAEQTEAKVAALKSNADLTTEQRDQMIHEQQSILNAELIRENQHVLDAKIAAEERFLAKAERVNDQIASSARTKGMQAAQSWQKAGGVGGAAFTAFSQNAQTALVALGEGSQDSSEIMRNFFLGSIADIAQGSGAFMMGDAFTTYPAIKFPELAAGAGLLALSGTLRALAGGKSKAGNLASGGGGGGGSFDAGVAGPNLPETQAPAAVQAQAANKKSVNVVIQGNYYETEQFRETIVDAVRKHQDATDWTVKAVNER